MEEKREMELTKWKLDWELRMLRDPRKEEERKGECECECEGRGTEREQNLLMEGERIGTQRFCRSHEKCSGLLGYIDGLSWLLEKAHV